MADPLRVLTVCTHNRTRSVIAEALLDRALHARGIDAMVRSTGTHAEQLPATDGAVRLLAERGIDVGAHRSRRTNDKAVSGADLIVTAESDHVVWIAGRWPDAFAKTFTLPELVTLGARAGGRRGRPIGEWLAELAPHRPPASSYLEPDVVAEVADPTGGPRRVWATSFAEIERLTTELAELLR